MKQARMKTIQKHPLAYAVSLALASLVASNAAMAQEAKDQTQEQKNEPGITTVTVVATRASQQSGIERKKNAATAIDSIVAEDVGALPDRNVGEAISRMSGIALDRGNYGEGVSVAVRGNGPDLTRVEIDGQAVQSAGGTDLAGGGDGRGNEFRQMPADLIKSVDVVKGSTADMTEGSLGGGIVIKTRTGLDFKKPFASLRVAGQMNTLNKKWQPDTNLILANKFLDGRLGVLVNASASKVANEMHQIQVATSSQDGYDRKIDFDNSPDKTFSFNPNTLNMADPATNAPSWTYTSNGKTINGSTPLDVVTKSANAKSKADCYAAFPQWTTNSPEVAGLSSSTKTSAIVQRGRELITCLNQWNDYTPSLIRNAVKKENEDRKNLDLRFDFKVNRDLTVYAKGSYNKRHVETYTNYLYLGDTQVNTSGTYADTNGVRAPVGAGYYVFPNTVSGGSTAIANGAVANIDPSSVVVDSAHHVTQYTITNGTAQTDQIHATTDTNAQYLQTGGTFKRDGFTAEFFIGDAKSKFQRGDRRSTLNYNYGTATLMALPSGLWTYSYPNGYDQGNVANYTGLLQPAASKAVSASATQPVAIPAYTAAQQPLLTNQINLSWNPQIRETEERTAKLDMAYKVRSLPFITRFKGGINLRDTFANSWGNGGSTIQAAQGTFGTPGYVSALVIPHADLGTHIVGCQDTPGSLGAGGNPCQFGYNPSVNPGLSREGLIVVDPQKYQQIINAALANNVTSTAFFGGAKGRPDALPTNWKANDLDALWAAFGGVPNANFDCVKQCVATDGKLRDQPVTKVKESVQSGYLMADFDIDRIPFTQRALPFGWQLEGNLGYRYIRTKVQGTGNMTFTSITKTGAYDPNNPSAAGGINTSSVAVNTQVDETTTDFLPAYNLAMWVVPDQVVLRYNRARTVARPPVSRLVPSGSCTYDERLVGAGQVDDVLQNCTKTIGNPLLQAQKNLNQNWSAEYYPNKDTMFSLAYFKQKGLTGPNIVQSGSGPLFPGNNLTDPSTGVSLANVPFNYSTYMNGPATTRKGWEFGSKTAFTFLPWYLRFTGLDANYTKLASVTSPQNVVDLISGDMMPPARESSHSYNWALWYDDGKLSARVAVQGVDSYFTCIASCSSSNVSNPPNVNTKSGTLAYNPGFPNYKDATRFVDAKISYKIAPNVEIFLEGRNLGNATTTSSQGPYGHFANGAPSLLDYNFAGRRIMVGLNYRTL